MYVVSCSSWQQQCRVLLLIHDALHAHDGSSSAEFCYWSMTPCMLMTAAAVQSFLLIHEALHAHDGSSSAEFCYWSMTPCMLMTAAAVQSFVTDDHEAMHARDGSSSAVLLLIHDALHAHDGSSSAEFCYWSMTPCMLMTAAAVQSFVTDDHEAMHARDGSSSAEFCYWSMTPCMLMTAAAVQSFLLIHEALHAHDGSSSAEFCYWSMTPCMLMTAAAVQSFVTDDHEAMHARDGSSSAVLLLIHDALHAHDGSSSAEFCYWSMTPCMLMTAAAVQSFVTDDHEAMHARDGSSSAEFCYWSMTPCMLMTAAAVQSFVTDPWRPACSWRQQQCRVLLLIHDALHAHDGSSSAEFCYWSMMPCMLMTAAAVQSFVTDPWRPACSWCCWQVEHSEFINIFSVWDFCRRRCCC